MPTAGYENRGRATGVELYLKGLLWVGVTECEWVCVSECWCVCVCACECVCVCVSVGVCVCEFV